MKRVPTHVGCDTITSLAKHISLKRLSVKSTHAGPIYIIDYENDRPSLLKINFYRKMPAELYEGPADNTYMHASDMEIFAMHHLRHNITKTNVSSSIVTLRYAIVCSGAAEKANIFCENIKHREAGTQDITQDLQAELCTYGMSVNMGLSRNRIAFLFMEICDITYDDYLENVMDDALTEQVVKSHIFTLIYTLAAIEKLYPGFRHGDLHTSNVMIKFMKKHVLSKEQFYLKYPGYYVPYYGMFIKIIDLGYAKMPSVNKQSEVYREKSSQMWRNVPDLYSFFKWVYIVCHTRGLNRISNILSSLDPDRSYAKFVQVGEIKFPTPAEMLANRIFDDYRKPIDVPPKQIVYSYSEIPDAPTIPPELADQKWGTDDSPTQQIGVSRGR
jgi:hypothetical protein